MKNLLDILRADGAHWVGDGFPVRSIFSYHRDAAAVSPFLLFDYAGPHDFAPNQARPRGVGAHPHRGFETVTIVFDGEVSHRDSAGGGGTIGTGDVQWMTAASGVIHDEFHSEAFSARGGRFRMVQLWVNLPAADKMRPPAYQAIRSDDIPTLAVPGASARIIAGAWGDTRGPATTHTPVNLWDVTLAPGAEIELPLPDGHNALIALLQGEATIAGQRLAEATIARLSVPGAGAVVRSGAGGQLLVMTGTPIDEPIVGHGPFVMTSRAEIVQAIDDYNAGRFGALAA